MYPQLVNNNAADMFLHPFWETHGHCRHLLRHYRRNEAAQHAFSHIFAFVKVASKGFRSPIMLEVLFSGCRPDQ